MSSDDVRSKFTTSLGVLPLDECCGMRQTATTFMSERRCAAKRGEEQLRSMNHHVHDSFASIPLVAYLCAYHGCRQNELHKAIAKAKDNVTRLKQLKIAFKNPIGEFTFDPTNPLGLLIQVDGLTFKGADKEPWLPRNGQSVQKVIENQFDIKLELPKLQCVISYECPPVDFLPLELLVVVTDAKEFIKSCA